MSPPEPIVVEELRADLTDLRGLDVDPATILRLAGGRDGLMALSVRDLVGEPVGPDDRPVAVAYKRRGLRALEEVDEVALLAVPDAQPRPIDRNPTDPQPPCEPDPCWDEPAAPPLPSPVGAIEQPPFVRAR